MSKNHFGTIALGPTDFSGNARPWRAAGMCHDIFKTGDFLILWKVHVQEGAVSSNCYVTFIKRKALFCLLLPQCSGKRVLNGD
jgi:hypothetical protein